MVLYLWIYQGIKLARYSVDGRIEVWKNGIRYNLDGGFDVFYPVSDIYLNSLKTGFMYYAFAAYFPIFARSLSFKTHTMTKTVRLGLIGLSDNSLKELDKALVELKLRNS